MKCFLQGKYGLDWWLWWSISYCHAISLSFSLQYLTYHGTTGEGVGVTLTGLLWRWTLRLKHNYTLMPRQIYRYLSRSSFFLFKIPHVSRHNRGRGGCNVYGGGGTLPLDDEMMKHSYILLPRQISLSICRAFTFSPFSLENLTYRHDRGRG